MSFHELERHGGARRNLSLPLELVAEGTLHAEIGMVSSWRHPGEPIRALLDRRVKGKAVMVVD
jgi:hypothetical protein